MLNGLYKFAHLLTYLLYLLTVTFMSRLRHHRVVS